MSDNDDLRSMTPGSIPASTIEELIRRAASARRHAYAPYSSFHVGAAVLTSDGRVFTGSNVENASYGLTMCAERVAVFGAVAAGAGKPIALVVSAEPAAWPCGACRQVLTEFAEPECPVIVAEGARQVAWVALEELLPHAFSPVFRPPAQSG